MERRLSGIECVMGEGQSVLLPVDAVGQIIEYDVAPLPLSSPFVGGVGLHDGALLVSISLQRALAPLDDTRRVGALLTLPARSPLRWAVELSHAVALTNITTVERLDHEPTLDEAATWQRPGWLTTALARDGRSLLWLDVPRLLRDVGAV